MSLRMALAKLCACACGGAIIGGGAVHIAESPRPAHLTKIKSIKHAPKEQAAERIRRTVTTTACAPGLVTIATQAAPIPLHPGQPAMPAEFPVTSSGGGVPVVTGRSGGWGGSGRFFGCFFGGGASRGRNVVVASTPSGGSPKTGGDFTNHRA